MHFRYEAIGAGLAFTALVTAGAVGVARRHASQVPSEPTAASAASTAPCGTDVEACGAHAPRIALNAKGAARPIEGRPRMLVFSSRSCPACKRMDPVLERALEACGGERDVYRVDFDDEAGETLAATYGVTLLPSFLSVDANGLEVARRTGLQPQAQIERAIEEVRGVRCASADEPKRARAM